MVVVVVMLVGIGSFVASLAISGYQEYSYLSSQFAQEFQHGGNLKNVDFVFDRSTESVLLYTHFQILNKMIYPLSMGLNGTIILGGFKIYSFSNDYPSIMPGKVQDVFISLGAYLSNITDYHSLLTSMFLSAVDAETNLTASFSIDQLFNFNIVHSTNWTMGPILGQLKASGEASQISDNGVDWILPLTVTWNNTSPLSFPLNLTGVITKLPGSISAGNYGGAYSNVSLTEGVNQNTLYFHIPVATISNLSSGVYSFNLSFSSNSSTVTIPENLTL